MGASHLAGSAGSDRWPGSPSCQTLVAIPTVHQTGAVSPLRLQTPFYSAPPRTGQARQTAALLSPR
jgi:hypothetical protein